jgi:hypothetical protein
MTELSFGLVGRSVRLDYLFPAQSVKILQHYRGPSEPL